MYAGMWMLPRGPGPRSRVRPRAFVKQGGGWEGGGGAHVRTLGDAQGHGAVVAAKAGVAEAAALATVPDAAAVVQGSDACQVAGVDTHVVVVRADLRCCTATGVSAEPRSNHTLK